MATLQDKLEEVIEKLSKKVPLELNADDGLQDSNWNATVVSIKLLTEALSLIKNTPSSLPYKGAPYFRMPGMKKPWEALPFSLENEWICVHKLYPGDFMRFAGGNASRFKAESTSISHDSTVKGYGGGQMDALQEHQHHQDVAARRDTGSGSSTSYYDGNVTSVTRDLLKARSDVETRSKNVTIELYIYKGKDV